MAEQDDMTSMNEIGNPDGETRLKSPSQPTSPQSPASASVPSSIAGYLLKKSTEGSWQRRYFETSGHFLTYYKSSKMTKLLAALALPQVGEIQYIGPVEDNKGTGAIFQLDLKDRQYVLRAEDEDTAKRWVDVLIVLRDSEVSQTPSPSPMKSPIGGGISTAGQEAYNGTPQSAARTQGIGGGKPIPTPGEEAKFVKKNWESEIPDGCCVIS